MYDGGMKVEQATKLWKVTADDGTVYDVFTHYGANRSTVHTHKSHTSPDTGKAITEEVTVAQYDHVLDTEMDVRRKMEELLR